MPFLFALLFILLIAGFARQAWHHGVLTQYWGICGLAGGIAAGYLFFQNSAIILERMAPDLHLPLIPNVIVSAVIGLLVYFVLRHYVKSFLSSLFGEETWLSGWTEGFRGAFLSLLPGIITVAILASGIRLSGTLLELRHLENICRPAANFTTKQYPHWPAFAKWRDAVEKIPFLTTALDPVDPVSRIKERLIVDLLVASKNPKLVDYLRASDPSSAIFKSKSMQTLLATEEITRLSQKFQHVTLILHPLVKTAAADPQNHDPLTDLQLQPLIDEFMLSPERQQTIKNQTVVSR
ncbi:MAG: hypothetical protein L3J39_03440 [Verrucomicrobiales bacterium]|nr:hypothetical protein [Verrucomicrobiales bacterium]